MARGRKRKAGDRYPGGKLRPAYDHGSEWVQARTARFGVHYNTALGRAYAAGLLGDDADDRYQGGKKFARVYQRMFGGEVYRCALDQTPRGQSGDEAPALYTTDRDWMFATMDALDVGGLRPWLDQLISRAHTDRGPEWLDRLLAGGKDPVDKMLLQTAIKALDVVSPAKREQKIISAHWYDNLDDVA